MNHCKRCKRLINPEPWHDALRALRDQWGVHL